MKPITTQELRDKKEELHNKMLLSLVKKINKTLLSGKRYFIFKPHQFSVLRELRECYLQAGWRVIVDESEKYLATQWKSFTFEDKDG
jgi:hypothetical protein